MDIAEVEGLIKQFYGPRTDQSQDISQIQLALQELQRSPEGWQLADALLASNDPNSRFFGALTFTVKLNSEELTADRQTEVLERLIYWYTRLTAQSEAPHVLRKMSTTLVIFFLRPSSSWRLCVRQLAACMHAGSYITEEAAAKMSLKSFISKLSPGQLSVLAWFMKDLALEAYKVERNANQDSVHRRVQSNFEDVTIILGFSFVQGNPHEDPANLTLMAAKFLIYIVQCWSAWVSYSQVVTIEASSLLAMQALYVHAVQCLFVSVGELSEETCYSLNDLIKSSPDKLTRSWILTGITGKIDEHFQTFGYDKIDGGSGNIVNYASILLACCSTDVSTIVSTIDEPGTQRLMEILQTFLQMSNYPTVDEDFVLAAVDFWQDFGENGIDMWQDIEDQESPAAKKLKEHELRAARQLWDKICWPPSHVTEEWDEDNRSQFNEFRHDVKDFFVSVYYIFGDEILKEFASLLAATLQERSWWRVEAAITGILACISGLDAHDEDANNVISMILEGPLFAELASHQAEIPVAVIRAAVDLVGTCSPFISRHVHLLAPALNFLFANLKAPAIATIAAKAISQLCSSCRKPLIPELKAFMQQYEEFCRWPSADVHTKSRVIGAISMIAQAQESNDAQLASVQHLLNLIEGDVATIHLEPGTPESRLACATTALTCLSSMAKAFQSPDGTSVVNVEFNIYEPNFWNSGGGSLVQEEIAALLTALQQFIGSDTECLEQAYGVLRAGYKETAPGPFVLHPGTTVRMFQALNISTPNVEFALSSIVAFLAAHSTSDSELRENDATQLLLHIVNFLQDLGTPNKDATVSQGCFSVLERFVRNYRHILLSSDPAVLNIILSFSISCIGGLDMLPKRAAVSFWIAYLDQPHTDPSHRILQQIGPALSTALMDNVGGAAPRSALAAFSPLILSLLKSGPSARSWIEAALVRDQFAGNARVGRAEKVRFVTQLSSIRSTRIMTKVVTDFWIICRGTVQSFGT